MRPALIVSCALAAALALAACASGAAGEGASAQLSGSSAQGSCPVGEMAVAAPLELEEFGADGGVLLADPPKPAFEGKVLVPPERPGESVFEAQGCLAVAEAGDQLGARYPPPEASRAAEGPAVRVTPVGRGAIITYDLAHACCLQADVKATVEGFELELAILLTGNPCRCRCASTVRAAVGLVPGDYELTLVVNDGTRTEVYRGRVEVPRRSQER